MPITLVAISIKQSMFPQSKKKKLTGLISYANRWQLLL